MVSACHQGILGLSPQKPGIGRLVNLEYIAYSAMTLLPYSDEAFSCYQSASVQETRFDIRQQIQASIIFSSFVRKLETVKNSCQWQD